MNNTDCILVTEDLEEDAELLRIAWSQTGSNVPMRFVKDGQKAIHYLTGEGAFADRNLYPLPTLLLLDLKMPLLDGFGLLKWLRAQQPPLGELRTVVFSSSALPEDMARANALGANNYVVKPTDFVALQHLLQQWANDLSIILPLPPASSDDCP